MSLVHGDALPSPLQFSCNDKAEHKLFLPLHGLPHSVGTCSMLSGLEASVLQRCKQLCCNTAACDQCCLSPKLKRLWQVTVVTQHNHIRWLFICECTPVTSQELSSGALREAFQYSTAAGRKFAPVCLHTPSFSVSSNCLEVMKSFHHKINEFINICRTRSFTSRTVAI